jgi:hypothetical protein
MAKNLNFHHYNQGVTIVPVRYTRTLDEALRVLSRELHPRKPRKQRIVKMPVIHSGA